MIDSKVTSKQTFSEHVSTMYFNVAMVILCEVLRRDAQFSLLRPWLEEHFFGCSNITSEIMTLEVITYFFDIYTYLFSLRRNSQISLVMMFSNSHASHFLRNSSLFFYGQLVSESKVFQRNSLFKKKQSTLSVSLVSFPPLRQPSRV